MKTIEQHLKELPKGYRELALQNMDQCDKRHKFKTQFEAVARAFSWPGSSEGFNFWRDVEKHCRTGSPLPALPTQPKTKKPNTNHNTMEKLTIAIKPESSFSILRDALYTLPNTKLHPLAKSIGSTVNKFKSVTVLAAAEAIQKQAKTITITIQ